MWHLIGIALQGDAFFFSEKATKKGLDVSP
jgi:hypothetical protein